MRARELINWVVKISHRLMPKFSSWVAFMVPFEEDNALAVYRALLKSEKVKRIFWLVPKVEDFDSQFSQSKSMVVRQTSFMGRLFLFFSRTVFLTHSGSQKLVDNGYVVVNLWHGFGFKAVGLLNGEASHPATYTIATSNFSRSIIAQEMGVLESSVLIVGHPRNDIMRKSTFDLNAEHKFSKVVLWMPTYRSDNEFSGQYNPYNVINFDIKRFVTFLEDNRILCIFRAHPLTQFDETVKSDHFILGNNDFLKKKKCSLYELIGSVDVLISDISSVITDFLLLDRPIIHAMSDLITYSESRNMLLRPIDSFFAGPFCQSQGELERELRMLVLDEDRYCIRRAELRDLFYDSLSYDSSEKLLKIINLI